ncbi:tumor necrosis factor receptor superfamily member 13B [Protobothrops mucrosquamatus]|uniref:tumor necrosis factor receptor superfamily member 13B n=1 Tax=Protobothrops mucrosquamatus TaxID=103944 RepID=UPI0010FBAD7C|nr:tumor necrosis factor receptor superfamily member 13B [Protobothrops mucrosquamatus]
MQSCSKEQYWDGLLGNCVSCEYACQPLKSQGCADVCSSMECSKQEGSYYDQLLRECIKCFSICGQHPKQCAPFCRRYKTHTGTIPRSRSVTFLSKMDRCSHKCSQELLNWDQTALQPLQRKMDATFDQQVFLYVALGFSFCILLLSLLLTWIYFKKRGDKKFCRASSASCHKKGDLPKDGLMEAGSFGSESGGNQTPDPIETCGFCFPEVSAAIQETRACPRPYQLEMLAEVAAAAATPGRTVPASPEDCHFQIICSPSQEKMQMS